MSDKAAKRNRVTRVVGRLSQSEKDQIIAQRKTGAPERSKSGVRDSMEALNRKPLSPDDPAR